MIAILDTNSDPDGITYPSSQRRRRPGPFSSIASSIARAVIDGISRSQAQGVDLGEAGAPVAEPKLPETTQLEASGPSLETSTDPFVELLAAPRGAPDDLAKLTGVGPQIVKKLNEHGVFHYWQLAAMTPEEAEKLDADLRFNGRIARDKLERAGARADGRVEVEV